MVIKNIRAAISPLCNMKCRYCSNTNEHSNARMEDFRRKPLSDGVLSTNQWLHIFKCFYDAGFRGISLTGGEPTLNPDWLKILKYCNELGFLRTEITSNLLDLDTYKDILPTVDYITRFKVSLDTFDRDKFKYLTRVDALDQVLSNIKFLCDLGFNVQLNRVTMKSTQKELVDYIEQAAKLKVSLNLLDLVYYKNGRPDFSVDDWANEFVTAESTWTYLNNQLHGVGPIEKELKYGYRTLYKNMNIIFKDSRLTKRAEMCQTCPLYCQEGIFTVRIASDGTITTCPDYLNEVPYIDGVAALEDNSLTDKLMELYKYFEIKEENHFTEYIRRLRA